MKMHPALTESMSRDIWVVRTSNKLFLRDFKAEKIDFTSINK